MKVVNKYRFVGKGVNIMRPTVFGNPFVIGRDGTREQVIEKFRLSMSRNQALMNAIADLKEDDVLVCCCKPKACHGDEIVKMFWWIAGSHGGRE